MNLCSLNVTIELSLFFMFLSLQIRFPLKNVFHYKLVTAHSQHEKLDKYKKVDGGKNDLYSHTQS